MVSTTDSSADTPGRAMGGFSTTDRCFCRGGADFSTTDSLGVVLASRTRIKYMQVHLYGIQHRGQPPPLQYHGQGHMGYERVQHHGQLYATTQLRGQVCRFSAPRTGVRRGRGFSTTDKKVAGTTDRSFCRGRGGFNTTDSSGVVSASGTGLSTVQYMQVCLYGVQHRGQHPSPGFPPGLL